MSQDLKVHWDESVYNRASQRLGSHRFFVLHFEYSTILYPEFTEKPRMIWSNLWLEQNSFTRPNFHISRTWSKQIFSQVKVSNHLIIERIRLLFLPYSSFFDNHILLFTFFDKIKDISSNIKNNFVFKEVKLNNK